MNLSHERAVGLLSDLLPAGAVTAPEGAPPLRVPGAHPAAIVFPSTEEELSSVLRLASSEGWGVIPAGHGGGLHVGNRPRRADLILSTARLTGLTDYEPADLTLTARAGTRLGTLQAELAKHGQFLPLDPPGAAEATLGGVAAIGWSGSLKPGFGQPRDHLLGARAVLASGVTTRSGGRVVKNVAGYDLHRLYVGSFGTLCVLTEISLKVRPLPAADETLVLGADDWLPLLTLALRTLKEPWPLACCDLLSPGLAMPSGAFDTPRAALALRVMDSAATADDLLANAAALAEAEGVRTSRRLGGAESAAFWKGLTETEVLADDALTARAATAPGLLAGVLGEARRALPADASLSFHAHATSGIVRLFVRGEASSLTGWIESVRTRAAGGGGHLIVERSPEALLDRVDVWGAPGPSAALAKRIKDVHDPEGILSPGRFADGV